MNYCGMYRQIVYVINSSSEWRGKKAHRRLNKSEKWNLNWGCFVWAKIFGRVERKKVGVSRSTVDIIVDHEPSHTRHSSELLPPASFFLGFRIGFTHFVVNLFAVRYKRINTQGQQFIYEREPIKKRPSVRMSCPISVSTSKGGHLV